MRKFTDFDDFDSEGWPDPDELETFFLAPKGKEWSYSGGNDIWCLEVDGLLGTANEPIDNRVKVRLAMTGHPDHGVYLDYVKWDGRLGRKYSYCSKGNLSRLREFVPDLHGTEASAGFFIPFAEAWKAVKEFIQTDGELPKSIEWLASEDIPPEAFPDY